MKENRMAILLMASLMTVGSYAQSVRQSVLLDDGWRFALGNASDPQKDFGCGTEYFN